MSTLWRSLVCLFAGRCPVFEDDEHTEWLRRQEQAARTETEKLASERRGLMDAPLLPRRKEVPR